MEEKIKIVRSPEIKDEELPEVHFHNGIDQPAISLGDLPAGTDHATLSNVTIDQHHARDHASRHLSGGGDALTLTPSEVPTGTSWPANIVPDADGTRDLGSSTKAYDEVFAKILVGPTVYNELGADVDLRVEGDTDLNLVFTDASTDRVGIGTATPSTKLEVAGVVSSKMGTSTSVSALNGTANVNNTAVGNVLTGEDDLITYSLPTNALTSNQKGIRITAWGTAANNANAKTLKVYFGTQIILTTSLTVSQVDTWRVAGTVWRTSLNNQDWECSLIQAGTASLIDVENGTAIQTETSAIIIKCTGEATATDDIIMEGMIIEYLN